RWPHRRHARDSTVRGAPCLYTTAYSITHFYAAVGACGSAQNVRLESRTLWRDYQSDLIARSWEQDSPHVVSSGRLGSALMHRKGFDASSSSARSAGCQPAARGSPQRYPYLTAGAPGAGRLTVGARPRGPRGQDAARVLPDSRRGRVTGPG